MIYDNCPLYGLNSKKVLVHLLKIPSAQYINQKFIANKIHPYIETNECTGKKRLLEPPEDDIKSIQTRIKVYLSKIVVPDYVFSGIKNKSYIGNAIFHAGKKYLFKTDLTAFFPSTTREKVYSFFRNKLMTSSDVANILTNFTTIDLDFSSCNDIITINNFLDGKGVTTRNHLISGAPTSQILSYLSNVDMFDSLYALSSKHNIIMTVYVDDVTFSSTIYISKIMRRKIIAIFQKNGFRISDQKVKFYYKTCPKLVTGVIINYQGKVELKNSLRRKIIDEFTILLNNPTNKISRKRLRGLITSARQIDHNAFPSINAFAFDKKYKIN